MRIGLTKARSMGAVADAVEQAGGSVSRVFARAEMPLRLIEEPDRLILLSDQLRIVESAAREVGDVALPARLSLGAGVPSLGPYGVRVCASARLDEALLLGTSLIVSQLQTATRMAVVVESGLAHVTYGVTDASDVGRQKNEVLAIGYILDVLRRFLGLGFVPRRASVTGATLQGKVALEDVLGCELTLGSEARVSFDAALLMTENPGHRLTPTAETGCTVPETEDFLACIDHLIRFALLDRRPALDWLCARLGLSRRSLQRLFAMHGSGFAARLHAVLESESKRLLAQPTMPIGVIALELGYTDAAHFSRAFQGWTGMPPRAWRQGRSWSGGFT